MAQKVLHGKEARDKIIKGINTLADAVVSTLGPNGRNVIYINEQGEVHSTKDGVSIAKKIVKLEDEAENLGVNLIKQASIKTADKAGDGTTTSTLLAQKMILKGSQVVEMGKNVTELKREMEEASRDVTEILKKQISEEISSQEQLKNIATISANNDEEIGNIISQAMEKVGMDGVVHIEESKTSDTYLENVEGIQFDRGYKSPYFVTDNNTMQTVFENPYILIINQKLANLNDYIPVLERVSADGKSLVIIAEDIEGEALSTLVLNKMRGILNSVAIKAPDFGDRRKLILEDIAIATGGISIDPEKGMDIKSFDMDWLGTARKVVVEKSTTTIIDGAGEEEQLLQRAEQLQNQINQSNSPYEIEQLQNRLARFSGGISIIHVGGNTEAEMKERKDRVEDALHATKAAIEEGIVPGGGIALLRVSNLLDWEKINTKKGYELVYNILSSPITQILSNAGYDKDMIGAVIEDLQPMETWDGYNINTLEKVNMKDFGVIDPTKVVRSALQNAVSIASTVLLTETIVVDEEEETQPAAPDFGNMMM